MKYIEQFLKHLEDAHFNKSTIENYYYQLKRAKNYFEKHGIYDEKSITEKEILNLMDHLQSIKVSNWIYHRTVLSLKIYFKYLENEEIIFLNPASNIEIPKEIKVRTKALTVDEVKEAISRVDTSDDYGVRVRMILEVLYSSGMRPGELINLKLTDIDFSKKIIFINQGKMKKDRVVPAGDTAFLWLEKYIHEVRPKYIVDKENNHLLISFLRTGRKLKYQAFYCILRRAFDRYGIKRFKPYSMRPSCATHLLQNGLSILHIQKLLGHNDFKTTQAYLRVSKLDLKRELESKHPGFKSRENNNREEGDKK